jgi:RNA polymerase sigma-70 factor (ECF subfamily)
MMTLEVFESVKPALWRYAMSLTRKRETAEELLQETFLRAWKTRTKYETNNPAGWLAAIMHNVHVTDTRIRRKSVDTVNVDALDVVIHARQAENKSHTSINGGYEEIVARQVLQRLTPTESHILYCAGIKGQCHKEIADSMGLSEQAVKTRVHRARVKLAAAI